MLPQFPASDSTDRLLLVSGATAEGRGWPGREGSAALIDLAYLAVFGRMQEQCWFVYCVYRRIALVLARRLALLRRAVAEQVDVGVGRQAVLEVLADRAPVRLAAGHFQRAASRKREGYAAACERLMAGSCGGSGGSACRENWSRPR